MPRVIYREKEACAMPIKGAVSAPKMVGPGVLKNGVAYAPKAKGLGPIKGAVNNPKSTY